MNLSTVGHSSGAHWLSHDPEVIAIVGVAFWAVEPRSTTHVEACARAWQHLLELERRRWAAGDYRSKFGPAIDIVAAMFRCAAKGAPS